MVLISSVAWKEAYDRELVVRLGSAPRATLSVDSDQPRPAGLKTGAFDSRLSSLGGPRAERSRRRLEFDPSALVGRPERGVATAEQFPPSGRLLVGSSGCALSGSRRSTHRDAGQAWLGREATAYLPSLSLTIFEPGRSFANEPDYQAQLERGSIAQCPHPSDERSVPAERLVEVRRRLGPLPDRLPAADRRFVTHIPQQPYLRFAFNDYSLDPQLVRRRVEVRASGSSVGPSASTTANSPPATGALRAPSHHRPSTPARARGPTRRAPSATASPIASAGRFTTTPDPGMSASSSHQEAIASA